MCRAQTRLKTLSIAGHCSVTFSFNGRHQIRIEYSLVSSKQQRFITVWFCLLRLDLKGKKGDTHEAEKQKWDVQGLRNDTCVCVCLLHSEKRVGNVYSKAKSFVDYVRRALRRLELDESKVRASRLTTPSRNKLRKMLVTLRKMKMRENVSLQMFIQKKKSPNSRQVDEGAGAWSPRCLAGRFSFTQTPPRFLLVRMTPFFFLLSSPTATSRVTMTHTDREWTRCTPSTWWAPLFTSPQMKKT